MPTHLFLFVKRSLILLLAHTHGHTLIETFVLVFSCCYFCGCIAPPQMTPPHSAHALYLCLSCSVRVSAFVCVWPHMHFATPTERRSQRRSQRILASAVQFARSVFILLRSVIHVNVVVAVVAVVVVLAIVSRVCIYFGCVWLWFFQNSIKRKKRRKRRKKIPTRCVKFVCCVICKRSANKQETTKRKEKENRKENLTKLPLSLNINKWYAELLII